jgi:hypothetical protein
MAALPKFIECPDHAGRTDVQAGQRQRLLPRIPIVCQPERLRIERRVGVGNDRSDRLLDARRNPRLVGQSIEPQRGDSAPLGRADHRRPAVVLLRFVADGFDVVPIWV